MGVGDVFTVSASISATPSELILSESVHKWIEQIINIILYIYQKRYATYNVHIDCHLKVGGDFDTLYLNSRSRQPEHEVEEPTQGQHQAPLENLQLLQIKSRCCISILQNPMGHIFRNPQHRQQF